MEKLGDLINKELRKQNWNIVEFADRLSTSRGNVYKILNKGNLDVELLGKISKVLNHNFFEDVALNLDMVNYTEKEKISEGRAREKAIVQFLDVVPQIMSELGRTCMIQFEDPSIYESVYPLPEYIMVPYAITFAYGEPYKNKTPEDFHQLIKTIQDEKGRSVEIISLLNNAQCCNIVIDYKTKEEWREMMRFALEVINKYYTPYNKMLLERDFNHRIIW